MAVKTISYVPSPTLAEFHACPKDIRGVRGPVGCLPNYTEVMTPRGWVRIDEWNGQEILQWHSRTGECEFLQPKKYIVGECDEFIRFNAGKHLQMIVTDNHRVPLYNWSNKFVIRNGGELAKKLSKHTVPTTWSNMGKGVALSDDELRLWVAICADGHYYKVGRTCEFGLRKERKIVRLQELLTRLGIEWRQRECFRESGARETRIRFDRPETPKHFDWRLSAVTRHQAEVIMDELSYWDGLVTQDYDRYDTTNKTDADIVQFVSHCAGRNATLTQYADKRNKDWSINYSLYPAKVDSPKNKVQIRCDSTTVSRELSEDGKQYCFETTTGFFVVRQYRHIFITGNSGKSVGCCFDIFLRSMEQLPGGDGVIRNRWLVLRNTLPELRDTTIKTWLHWFPTTQMNWTPPYHGKLVVPHIRDPKTKVEIELIFYGCDQPDFEEKLKSLDITGVWGNEASQIRWPILSEAYNRCGRYPHAEGDRKFKSWGLLMDTNSPDDSNWWYKEEVVRRNENMAFFAQPPALIEHREKDGRVWYEPNMGQDPADPRKAENIEHLNEGYGYYLKQCVTSSEDSVRRLVLNQFGTSIAGKPVYPEWRDEIHYAKEDLKPDFGMPFILGTDFGRTPATIIGQMTTDGQIRILDEVISHGMGITQFTQEILRPLMINKYRILEGHTRIVNFADPAGARADQVDEVTCVMRMNQNGIHTVPCPNLPNNSFILRRECVSDLLRSRRDGKPAIIVSRNCEFLRKGFNGGYAYRKMRGTSGGDERYSEEADKNEYSHPHDALQYLCYGALHSAEDFQSPTMYGFNSNMQHFDYGLDLGGFGV